MSDLTKALDESFGAKDDLVGCGVNDLVDIIQQRVDIDGIRHPTNI